jgi:hypothetical protein
MTDKQTPEESGSPVTLDRRVAEEIARALAGLRFGSVEITVHDGKITQIETKRKVRLT